jgi:hypothetical protein
VLAQLIQVDRIGLAQQLGVLRPPSRSSRCTVRGEFLNHLASCISSFMPATFLRPAWPECSEAPCHDSAGIPHALHMPPHIFSRIGYWQDSVEMNTRSDTATTTDRDAYHAMDYLCVRLLAAVNEPARRPRTIP